MDGLGPRRSIETAALTVAGLRRLWAGWSCDKLILSSVVPEKTEIVRKAFPSTLLEVSPHLNLGMRLDYPAPDTLGQDRLANVAGLAALYAAPAVVIDFGTATTFDVLSPDRTYVGGVIAPGLEAMTDYLHERTALLPKVALRSPRSVVGRSTRKAILSGTVFGYPGLVSSILTEVKQEISPRKRLRVVATGGASRFLASRVPEIDEVNDLLTLEGLRVIGALNP